MNYKKIDTPENFVFADKVIMAKGDNTPGQLRFNKSTLPYELIDCGANIFRLRVSGKRWTEGNPSYARIDTSSYTGVRSSALCTIDAKAGFSLTLGSQQLLSGPAEHSLGVNGSKWMLCLTFSDSQRFYGMGGKNLGFELSGKRTKFWNTDLLADFDWDTARQGNADPLYTSFPVLLIKTAGTGNDSSDNASQKSLPQKRAIPQSAENQPCSKSGWAALLINNSYPVFMNTGAGEGIFAAGSTPFHKWLYAGSTGGAPEIFIIAGDSAAEVICKIQTLQGKIARPPLWALGHHQSRWGYRSYSDLDLIAREYENRRIPNDGLWLDIDYMEDFKVFTINKRHFVNPAEQIAELKARGFKVVPILDPGLRRDDNFIEYREASAANLLCKTAEGQNFTGFVWPGYTCFPDFALEAARAFWAERVEQFAKLGFEGFWIDMNDPSTGSAPLEDMRFQHGKLEHESWHNQYALAMAEATKTGLERAHPGKRSFVISRSAFLSMSRHSAVWTGDNISNTAHLKNAIAFSLNLSLSGMPFNGPDVPGFVGDASDALLRCWYKAGFLFPFFRNHNVAGAKDQEPWSRDKATLQVVADFIRSRYRFLPYMYQLFIEHEQSGAPIMRPLWYHYAEERFETIADCFMLGAALLHAPILDEQSRSRTVSLPQGTWYDFTTGKWLHTSNTIIAKPGRSTPLFGAERHILPLRPGQITDNRNDLSTVDFLVLAIADKQGSPAYSFSYRYYADDGASTAYQEGQQSSIELRVEIQGTVISFTATMLETNYGPVNYRVLLPKNSGFRKLLVNGQRIKTKTERIQIAGRRLRYRTTELMNAGDQR